MAWVRLDDGFTEHPKVWAAGPHAVTLIVRALCWASRNLTDGYIPRNILPLLMVGVDDVELPGKLIAAGIWEREDDLGFWIHDYLVYNRSRKQVEKERRDSKKRMKEYRARSAHVTPKQQGNLPGVRDSPAPRSRSSSASEAESLVLEPQTGFAVAPTILEALEKCDKLGKVPALRSPKFWKAMIRAHQGVDFPAEIMLAEAFLVTHPGYQKYTQFLGNWFRRAARDAKEE